MSEVNEQTTDHAASTPRVAFLFPGQGSQNVGMGRDFFESNAVARATFEEADDAIGFALSKLIFEGPAEQLGMTEYTQPAILTASVAMVRVFEPLLRSRGVTAEFAAGHSLGEYTAHVFADTFSFADAVRVAHARGKFMQSAVPAGMGGMCAILGLEVAQINDICARVSDELTQAPPQDPGNPSAQTDAVVEQMTDPNSPATTPTEAASRVSAVVAPANMNSPMQTVISGEKSALERAAELCKQAGARRTVMLPVSAPFHCALMQPAQEQLANALESIAFHDPAVPVVSNVDALFLRRASESRDTLIRQVTGAVRWVESVQLLKESGVTHCIEVGPGKVLGGLVRQIDKSIVVASVDSPASMEEVLTLFAGAAPVEA